MKQVLQLIFFCSIFGFFSANAQTTTVSYAASNDDFVNPERGFYRYSATSSLSYSLLDSATLAGYRSLHSPFGADYSIYSSLIYRYFFLEDFKNGPISQAYLDNVALDFATARKAGVKLIVRFAYTEDVNSNGCSSWICPPYGDAPKNIVLGHIAQLEEVLNENADVIMALQMGFIGVWGENYYTDYFGDASQSPYNLLSNEWTDRVEVLDSLLSAVPPSRQVQVRYPQMKQKAVYGISAPTTSAPMTAMEAHDGSNKSRIGFHNDCFLANYDDYGTYANYDNGSSDTTNLKPYKADDSKYVMVGGETCNLYSGSYCESEGGMADIDLERMHYTYLNAQYNNDVNNEWIGSCMDDVKRGLGYRLVLLDGEYSDMLTPGGKFDYAINIENVGYSAPINERLVELILVEANSEAKWTVTLPHDPRDWHQGVHNLVGEICIPDCIPSGSYNLHLALTDPMPLLREKKEYSIRLANSNVWDNVTGYNDLSHMMTVAASSGTCESGLSFEKKEKINEWISPSDGNWYSSASNWSLGQFPDYCDEVFIPENRIVNILDGEVGKAKKLILRSDSRLEVASTGSMSLKN